MELRGTQSVFADVEYVDSTDWCNTAAGAISPTNHKACTTMPKLEVPAIVQNCRELCSQSLCNQS